MHIVQILPRNHLQLRRWRRKRIEESFGWIKTTAGFATPAAASTDRVGWLCTLTAVPCNLVRLPKLLQAA